MTPSVELGVGVTLFSRVAVSRRNPGFTSWCDTRAGATAAEQVNIQRIFTGRVMADETNMVEIA